MDTVNRWVISYSDGYSPRDHRVVVEAKTIEEAMRAPSAPPVRQIFSIALVLPPSE